MLVDIAPQQNLPLEELLDVEAEELPSYVAVDRVNKTITLAPDSNPNAFVVINVDTGETELDAGRSSDSDDELPSYEVATETIQEGTV